MDANISKTSATSTLTTKEPSAILNYLYIGDRNHAKSLSTLLKLNIKYIVNCTPPKSVAKTVGVSNYYEKDGRFKYLRVPVYDDGGENLLAYINDVFRFIEEGKHFGNVLVHCRQGISRSASFVIAYLMKKNEFTVDEALDYVRRIRAVVSPNQGFIEQLRLYERMLHPELAQKKEKENIDDCGGIPGAVEKEREKKKEREGERGQCTEVDCGPSLRPKPNLSCLLPLLSPTVGTWTRSAAGSKAQLEDEGAEIVIDDIPTEDLPPCISEVTSHADDDAAVDAGARTVDGNDDGKSYFRKRRREE